MPRTPSDWITEWNRVGSPTMPPGQIALHDETLRDGLQSPSVTQPTIGERLELLHLMDGLGIDSVDLGMPASSSVVAGQVQRLVAEIADGRLSLSPVCAARTTVGDIRAVAEVSQRAGLEMWVMAFVGISPIRMYVERWTLDSVLRDVERAISFARDEGLRVCLVTEDTTRSQLGVALDVYGAALDLGAERICVCDTVGYAVPWGATEVVSQLREGLADRGHTKFGIDWHGHNDRGLAIANSLAAACAGADRLHGSALGVGERAGNASMEQLLVNLCDLGWRSGDLRLLPRYCELASRACSVEIPPSQPLVGADAYRTATGVHAAAIRKARALGEAWLADRVYSGIPASLIGIEQRIEVGPGSGRANIQHWLEAHDKRVDPAVIEAVKRALVGATRVFTDAELREITAATMINGSDQPEQAQQ